jgi:hypothetical protein
VTSDRLSLAELQESAWSISRDVDNLIADVAEYGVTDSEFACNELEQAIYRLTTLLGAAVAEAEVDPRDELREDGGHG